MVLVFTYLFVFLATGILSNFNICTDLFESLCNTAPITFWIVWCVQYLANRIDWIIDHSTRILKDNDTDTAQ